MSREPIEVVRKGFFASRGEAVARALEKNWFDAAYFSEAADAVDKVLEIIPPDEAVGAGGSVTLREIGILERLDERGNRTVFHEPGMEFEQSMRVRREAIACSYFLTSSNAVTMEGELVNTDGIGNRVAGMIFGPQTVFVLAGVNKIVCDREEAFSRVRNVAAPANARRLGMDSPCVKAGRCVDCRSDYNICRVTTIVSARPMWTDLKVYIIGESLGL